MALLSLKQFQELIDTAIEYQPHRDRFTGQHPSAELFTGAGNVVNAIRLKFYVQDDGGTWDWTEIAKPQFIWDMKKIMASSVIDDGMANRNAHLATYSVNETDDGLRFYETIDSKLLSPEGILNEGLDFTKSTFNCWFRPSKNNLESEGLMFTMISKDVYKIAILIGTDQSNSDKFYIRVYARLTDTLDFDHVINDSQSIPFEWEKKYNLQVVIQNSNLQVIVNGQRVRNMPLSSNLIVSYPVQFDRLEI